jgi:hypothetical protein
MEYVLRVVFAIFAICQQLLILSIAVYIIVFICKLKGHEKGTPFWSSVTPSAFVHTLYDNNTFAVVYTGVMCTGLVWLVCSTALANTTMGSPFEKREYGEFYDAHIDFNGKEVFCIAYIDMSSDASGYLREALSDCLITIGSPATSTSWALLEASVISTSGEFCASKKSELYHTVDCRYAAQIQPENYIYFGTYEEAEYFGYYPHEDCFEP